MAREQVSNLELYDKMPYNPEAEQSVLGAILIDAHSITRVMEYIRPECFHSTENRELYSLLVAMFTAGDTIDIVTVLNEANNQHIFDSPEQAKIYLTRLVDIVPSASNIESYAKIVREKYYLRYLIDIAQEIIDESSDGQGDATSLLDVAEQRIFEIRQGRDVRGLTPIGEIMIDVYDGLQQLSSSDKDSSLGLPLGFSDLDALLNGVNQSDLVILAARPSVGKTSFAVNIATNVAKKINKTVAIFSLEMSKEQVVSRMLSNEASIDVSRLRTGELSGDDWISLSGAASTLSKCKIKVDDTASITVPEIKAKLRREKDLGLVIIDYLGLMSSGKRIDNRVNEVSEISRGLKVLAKDLNIPVIALSQMSRSSEQRSESRQPRLSDLRDSGAIEQDADMVMFLYRDIDPDSESEDLNIVKCSVAKNRHGAVGVIDLKFDGRYTRFTTLEKTRYDEYS